MVQYPERESKNAKEQYSRICLLAKISSRTNQERRVEGCFAPSQLTVFPELARAREEEAKAREEEECRQKEEAKAREEGERRQKEVALAEIEELKRRLKLLDKKTTPKPNR